MLYIWHCPNKVCKKDGIIMLKTESPYLVGGEMKCYKCQQRYGFDDVMRANIQNMERFLQNLQSNI